MSHSCKWSLKCKGGTGNEREKGPLCCEPQSQRCRSLAWLTVKQVTRCGSTLIIPSLSLSSKGWIMLKVMDKSKNKIPPCQGESEFCAVNRDSRTLPSSGFTLSLLVHHRLPISKAQSPFRISLECGTTRGDGLRIKGILCYCRDKQGLV